MPPIAKISKQQIIDIAYEIVKKEGFSSVNARRIAKELNCSVQPIFHNFKTMDEVKQIVYEKIYDTYKTYLLEASKKEYPYKSVGLAYIHFAKEYPNFFKCIFMQKTDLNIEKFMMADQIGDTVIKIGKQFTGLSYEEQKKFHIKIMIFVHGLATLVATNTVQLKDEEIEELVKSIVLDLLANYKKENL